MLIIVMDAYDVYDVSVQFCRWCAYICRTQKEFNYSVCVCLSNEHVSCVCMYELHFTNTFGFNNILNYTISPYLHRSIFIRVYRI